MLCDLLKLKMLWNTIPSSVTYGVNKIWIWEIPIPLLPYSILSISQAILTWLSQFYLFIILRTNFKDGCEKKGIADE